MRVAPLKKIFILTLGVAFVFSLAPTATTYAAFPYFKSFGADLFSGGWYYNQASSTNPGTCNTDTSGPNQAPYQDNFYDPANANRGGILTYAKEDATPTNYSRGGASSEYGVFALGRVDATDRNPDQYGFYSAGSLASIGAPGSTTLKDFLTFQSADSINTPWGGNFQGTPRQSHCIPDYYGTKQNSPPNITTINSVDLSGMSDGQYIASGPIAINSSAEVIDRGRKITLFVNGDATINGNITYRDNYDERDAPKFALVARGNIYIAPGVTRLDGLYIAQPAQDIPASVTSYNAGIIWTCYFDGAHPDPYTFYFDEITNTCRTSLEVRGAFVAKRVILMRTAGDLTAASTLEDSNKRNPLLYNPGPNVAEAINYTPEMVVGGPFFNQVAAPSLKVQSLVSLPPVL